jgi:dATP pyrophosphohydrolase
VTANKPDFRRPESVLVVVATRDGECLLLERVKPRGFWQSVTGSLLFDESIAAGAARELREETGIESDGIVATGFSSRFPILPAWRDRFAPDAASNLEHRCYLLLDHRVEVRLNPAEHAAYQWLGFSAAIAKVESWTNREALEAMRALDRS